MRRKRRRLARPKASKTSPHIISMPPFQSSPFTPPFLPSWTSSAPTRRPAPTDSSSSWSWSWRLHFSRVQTVWRLLPRNPPFFPITHAANVDFVTVRLYSFHHPVQICLQVVFLHYLTKWPDLPMLVQRLRALYERITVRTLTNYPIILRRLNCFLS